MNARTTALSALIACRRQNAWADGALKEFIARDKLSRRDAALASRLVYGVLQNRMLLDYYIQKNLKGKLKQLQPVVLDILRLGAYQILFLTKIPGSAAVNQAVEQTKEQANRQAAGLVNALLRNLLRTREELPQPEDLATRYSHPRELVELLRQSVGDELLEPLLKSHNDITPTVLQVNPLKADGADVLNELGLAEIQLQPHPWLENCCLVQGTGDLEALPAFAEGRVFVQDPAAHLAARTAGLRPGMRVLDACAAPGGKSLAAAMAMEDQGQILSCDIHPHKLRLIEKSAERLGVSIIRAELQDASKPREEFVGAFDAVLADVPCSGLGVIRKKPDIRYKELSQTMALPAIQEAILDNVCRYVRPGGVLLYSTCTILKRENEDVIRSFLAKHKDFSPEAFPVPAGAKLENDGMLTLLPCVHETDGFFICKLRRA